MADQTTSGQAPVEPDCDPRLALYIHWPGGLAAEQRLVRALAAAFERQTETAAPTVATILIGGTAPPPSPESLTELLDRLPPAAGGDAHEITLEVDPRAITLDRLAPFRRAGVDRLVLGAGALDANACRLATEALAIFPRIGLDLTFARPGQRVQELAAELQRAIMLGVGHLSLAEAGADDPPDAISSRSELGADHYLHAVDQLTAAGLPPYDSAHFARAGQESHHHLRVATGGAFMGIGPGAVGRQDRADACWALESIAAPVAWLAAVEAGGDGLDECRPLAPAERITELLATGLRLRAGVGRRWFEPLAGCPLEHALPRAALTGLIGDGFLILDARGLRLTARGWPLGDAVLRHLLA